MNRYSITQVKNGEVFQYQVSDLDEAAERFGAMIGDAARGIYGCTITVHDSHADDPDRPIMSARITIRVQLQEKKLCQPDTQ